MNIYSRGSMIAQNVLMDMELEHTIEEIMDNSVTNNSNTKYYAADIEKTTHTVK